MVGIIKMFKCDCCGLCCMNLKISELYSDLDRGDGICRFFDLTSKLCSIYKNRPDKCNIDKTYEKFYKNTMFIEEYYELNYEVCNRLKKKGNKKCI